MGLVNTAFQTEDLEKLRSGNLGIGHTRYSTTGVSELQNCQPFVVETLHGKIAVAHNGELVNSQNLRRKVMHHGVGLSTSSDSELITQLLALTPPLEEAGTPDWVARIKKLMSETPTSYSLLVMFKDVIYAVRDPYGNRPLCIGRLVPASKLRSADTEGWVVSSESCSFQSIGARYYREVLPGEIVQISKHGVKSLSIFDRPEGDLPAFCIFEYVYFARPDSIFEEQLYVFSISIFSLKKYPTQKGSFFFYLFYFKVGGLPPVLFTCQNPQPALHASQFASLPLVLLMHPKETWLLLRNTLLNSDPMGKKFFFFFFFF
uniref:Phosphoribosyl pyrophosphate amidotransferase n=1 Tax=Erpetoichthys calabaricus TaxID=27687 RepID=A0A8C4T4C3_ERPCA